MAKALKWVTFLYEILLSVPLVGGLYVLGKLETIFALLIALVLHLAAWLLLKKNDLPVTANQFGLVSSVLGFVPILGWILHSTTVFLLLIEVVVMHMREEDPAVQGS